MSIWHAVLVDDERLARRELRTLLHEAHSNRVRIVGEAATIFEAEGVVRATDPDLIFLDVHLGRESGLDLLPRLSSETAVVFVTAHDRYAVRAFEVNALDYLLKPVVPERLASAIDRLDSRKPLEAPEFARDLACDDRLFLRLDEQRTFLRVGDIVAIRAEGDNSILRLVDGRVARANKPLREWEDRLPERFFLRIHRSSIINLEFLERVEEWSHTSYLVYLRGVEEPFSMSRRYGARVRARLG